MNRYVLFAVLLLPLLLGAGDWEWSVGLNIRGFEDVTLDGVQLNGGAFIDGTVEDLGGGFWRYTVANPQMQVGGANLDEVTYRNASLGARVDGIDNGYGIVLGARRSLWETKGLRLSCEVSLAIAGTESGEGYVADQQMRTWSIAADSWNAGGVPDPNQLTKISGNHAEIAPPGASTASVRVRYGLDLGVYTLSTGLAVSVERGRFGFSIATGPTLSVLDYEVWRGAFAEGPDGSLFYRERDSTSGFRYRAGWYARLGCSWTLTENVSLNAGLRYDWVPVDLDTDLADVELSGPATEIACTFHF